MQEEKLLAIFYVQVRMSVKSSIKSRTLSVFFIFIFLCRNEWWGSRCSQYKVTIIQLITQPRVSTISPFCWHNHEPSLSHHSAESITRLHFLIILLTQSLSPYSTNSLDSLFYYLLTTRTSLVPVFHYSADLNTSRLCLVYSQMFGPLFFFHGWYRFS